MSEQTRWSISIRTKNQRKDIEMSTEGEETVLDTYRRVKQRAKKIDEKLSGQAIIDIISHSVPFKPKGTKPHKSWLWCPYCNKWRIFNYDDYLGTRRCNICAISTNEFYVRKYNNLWDRE